MAQPFFFYKGHLYKKNPVFYFIKVGLLCRHKLTSPRDSRPLGQASAASRRVLRRAAPLPDLLTLYLASWWLASARLTHMQRRCS